MDRRNKSKAPRPGMIWSVKHGIWMDLDRRAADQKARDEALVKELEADHERILRGLRRAEKARTKHEAAVDGAAEKLALAFLRSLIAARKKADLSQSEVARRMNVPQSAVVRLESGTHSPTLSTLARYAAAIGVKLEIRRIA